MDTKKLRQKILDLAIRGKLVPQDPNDEPASVLLERIRAEKERLVKEGKIKRSKKTATDTEIEAPFEIPESWEWCKLDDLAFYKKGPFGSSLTKSMFVPDTPDAYKVYEQKNAINKDATLGHYFIDSEKYEELKGFAVLPSDIIVSCAGTIGETYILPQGIREGIINQALMLIRLYDTSITYFYLLYFDYILKNEAAKESKGTAIKNIPPFEVLKNFLIPIPPLAEQQRIANEVERWFTLIDELESNEGDLLKAIDKAKSKILDLAIHGKLVPQDPSDEPAIELLKRINPKYEPYDNKYEANNIPGNWCLSNLKAVCTDFIVPQRDKPTRFDGDIPWCRIEDIEGKYLNGSLSNQNVSLDLIKEMNMRICPIGTVLCSCSASLGIQAITTVECCTNQTFIGIVPQKNVLKKDFLYYFLMSQTKKFYDIGTGTTIKYISRAKFEELTIPIPPLQEQICIIAKIEELFAVLDSIKESLEI